MSHILEPSVTLLKRLVPKSSLTQIDSLNKAIRMWMILDSMYRNSYNLKFPLTFQSWYDQLIDSSVLAKVMNFEEVHFDVKRVPLIEWLRLQPDFSQSYWVTQFVAQTHASPSQVEEYLHKTYPFGFLRESRLEWVNADSKQEIEKQCQHRKRCIVVIRYKERFQIRIYNRRGVLLADCEQSQFEDYGNLVERLRQASRGEVYDDYELIQWIVSAIKVDTSYRRLLRNDFSQLVTLGAIQSQLCLDPSKQNSKTQIFSPLGNIEEVRSILQLNDIQQIETSGQVLAKAIASEQLSDITQKYLTPIQGVQRFFMDLDYVVTEEGSDAIDELKAFLYEQVWQKGRIPPLIKFRYWSASRTVSKVYLTYPIAIYYSRRAPYLTAYGQTPQSEDKIQHYNFRLDRILDATVIPWPEHPAEQPTEIPTLLLEEYISGDLPTIETLQEEMEIAWGFDICLPAEPMILRFERQFHDAYIHQSDRHVSFEPVTKAELTPFLEFYGVTTTDIKVIEKRMDQYPEDAYYGAVFRSIENNIVMRLRAWGPKVEVLYPPTLKQRMEEDLQAAIAMYE